MTTPDILDPPVIDQSPVAPSPAHQDTTGPSAPDASASPAAQAFVPRRRRGPRPKIALLPPEQIALVIQLLDQDKTYEEIVAEMATHGVTLNIDNVSKWYNGPYQEYLDSLDWQEELQRVRSHALAFGPDLVNAPFQEGLLQIGLTQLFRDLKQDRYKDHPANAVRLFNALARLSREALVHRKYSDQCAKEKKEERKTLDPEREFNEKEHNLFLNAAERLFGFKPDKPIGPPLSEVYAKMAAAQSAAPPRPNSTPPSPATTEPTLNPPIHPGEDGRRRGDETLISEKKQPEAVQEFCPRCHASLPARATSGERPSPHCQAHGCGSPVRAPGAPLEPCPHCGVTLPDLLPNGERPATNCPECKKAIPPPNHVPMLVAYLASAKPSP